MSVVYRYDSADHLEARKPYGFSPFEGETFLVDYAAARLRVEVELDRRRTQPGLPTADAWMEEWVETCRRELPVLEGPAADHDPDPGGVRRTADLLQTALEHACARTQALAPADEAMVWRLVRRYEAFGRVYGTYDADWRRQDDDANPAAALVRLAAAAAWLALGSTSGARELAALNATLKIVDRCAAWLLHADATPSPTEVRWLLGALALERQLVARWEAS